MPAWLENELMAMARKKGLSGDDLNAYVFGTMNKMKKAWNKKHPGKPMTKAAMHRGRN